MATGLTLSVIVPVGPADRTWPALLGDLSALEENAEIVLVAPRGAAPAEFSALVHGLRVPARWLEAPAGRARQQNAGAAATGGELLWFLHADTRLTPAAIVAAQRFAEAALGYFDLRFADDGPALVRANAAGAWIRSRWLGLPFGDQGFILRREVFEALGGFDESLAKGEDHALVWTARRAGIPVVPLRAPLLTSARRYAEQGWLRTTLRHARLTIAQARRFRRDAARRKRP